MIKFEWIKEKLNIRFVVRWTAIKQEIVMKGTKPKQCYICKCNWYYWQRDIDDKKIYEEMKRFVDTDGMCNACLFEITDRLKKVANIFVKDMII